MNGERAPPIRMGETYDVGIDAVGGKGDGIAKVKGFVIFVPGAKKGDYVKIKITKVLPNVGFAEVVQQLEGAPPVREQKYATASREELRTEEPPQHYEDTEDFGDG